MKQRNLHPNPYPRAQLRWLVCLVLFCLGWLLPLTSCDLDGEMVECPYTARLEYWYIAQGSANVLPEYIHSLKQFVFNEKGVLLQVSDVTDSRRLLYGEFDLPPGRYTLATWANIDTVSRVQNARIGQSRPADLLLYPHRPYAGGYTGYAGYGTPVLQASTEPLFFGTDTFTVHPLGVTRMRINLVHCHLKLKVTIAWRGKAPADTGDFQYRLRSRSASYAFTVADEVNTSSEAWRAAGKPPIIYRIPEVKQGEMAYRTDVSMSLGQTLEGEFVTYRLTDDMHPLFQAFSGDRPLMKEIDLNDFFHRMGLTLNRSLAQEYTLRMEILENGQVQVAFITVSDWENGGVIGG